MNRHLEKFCAELDSFGGLQYAYDGASMVDKSIVGAKLHQGELSTQLEVIM